MSERNKLALTDDMIKQALHREFEAVTPPSADHLWAKIEAGLERAQKPDKKRLKFFSGPYVLAAAASLLLAVGVFGVYRALDFSTPVAEDSIALEALDDSVPAPAEEYHGVGVMEEGERAQAGFYIDAETDPEPPSWRPLLNADYYLGEALLISNLEDPDYRGAVYYGSEASLLWVKSLAGEEGLYPFIDNLGLFLDRYTEVVGHTNGHKYFEAEGQPGLAWQEKGINQALLVLSGHLTPEELKSIAAYAEQQ